jgi:hypothetical protein
MEVFKLHTPATLTQVPIVYDAVRSRAPFLYDTVRIPRENPC